MPHVSDVIEVLNNVVKIINDYIFTLSYCKDVNFVGVIFFNL